MVLSHTSVAAVLPQWEDLPNDRHAAQSTVGQLQDLCVADFLWQSEGEVIDLTQPLLCLHVN